MPFLRVIRDKRGYETTYLMHWFREGTRQYSKILYVFRTPGGVRVGRPALEPEVQRQLEAQHPQIDFDWPAVLDHRQLVDTTPEVRRPRKRRRDEEGGAAAPVAAAAPAKVPAEQRPRFVVPARVEGDGPDTQVAFLAHWYAVIRAQVEERATDPSRREALMALAERLNPAAWTDADQVTAGLLQASEALERLSHVFAKRRRRARKKKGAGPESAQLASTDHESLGAEADPSSTDSDPSSTESDSVSADLDPTSTD